MKYLLIAILLPFMAWSQIGFNTSTPNENSYLHISEKIDAQSSFAGFYFPSANQQKLDDLKTELLAEDDVENNGLLLFNSQERKLTYWSDTDWSDVSPLPQKSNFVFTCNLSNIVKYGLYTANTELSSVDNYITITLNVTKAGYYNIVLLSDNGYYFSTEGVFNQLGSQTITVPGYGTPIAGGTNNLTLKINNIETPCSFTSLFVEPPVSTYLLRCHDFTFIGSYANGTTMLTSNKLKMVVDAYSLGTYLIQTNTVNGIKFSKEGEFTTLGPNIIELDVTGTVNMQKETFILTTNSHGKINNRCLFGIPITQ